MTVQPVLWTARLPGGSLRRSPIPFCVLTVVATISANALAAEPTGIRHVVIPHPSDQTRRIEYLWTAPGGDGPWPAILYLHGHQVGDRPGARRYLNPPLLEETARKGFVAVAVSQPGYGSSDGPPDFCGPYSQEAVRAVLAEMRKNPLVRADRIVLFGYSRGAIVGAMVATREPTLAGVILGAGVYDMRGAYDRLSEGPEGQESLRGNIRSETGATDEAFRIRSVLLSGAKISVPTLILHGEKDAVSTVYQARQLAKRMKEWGTEVELAIFPDAGHAIPREAREPHVERFLKRILR